ncbi:lipopolysaccharide-induced tumor necrosis factor-alpha factor homolog [Solenopsis invicta]|uniref:lipopolysaccharide-induced tumor necrosis factor-alpha factor homolog n=1 Tax=Solenopsis invicta TaxID=13686 RepID=UPI0005961D95|nr:lipopolysaccharide-induced tumor necrosis factor-alpha factor homolog [Solenopsis invicta]
MGKMDQHSNTSPPYPYPQGPPPSMPPPSMPTHTVHVITSTAFNKESQHLICPHCHANISTRVETEANTKTHFMAMLLCLFGCCCCACCPYCMDSCQVHKHYCPACGSFLGASQN